MKRIVSALMTVSAVTAGAAPVPPAGSLTAIQAPAFPKPGVGKGLEAGEFLLGPISAGLGCVEIDTQLGCLRGSVIALLAGDALFLPLLAEF